MDMFSVMHGTTRDITMLMDFLPAYLYPYNEEGILEYGVLGVSQGGHASWMSLYQQGHTPSNQNNSNFLDRKLSFACSVIGCPDYNNLMELRLAEHGLEPVHPYTCEAFQRVLRRLDLGSMVRRWEEGPPERLRIHLQRLLEKSVLVLSGGDDKVVPWKASEHVVQKLQEVLGEAMSVKVYDGVGHEFTQEMKKEFKIWLVELLNSREDD